jgi:DNA adenine methylase
MIASALPPAIKWSGSKRSLAPHLALLIPHGEVFYDPFVGGGSILPFRKSSRAAAGDSVPELVALWLLIRDDPETLIKGYATMWEQLQERGHTLFYEVRERFNLARSPIDFFFLSRTCVNGLIRFNTSGDFNNSLHHTRPGIAPQRIAKVLREWNTAVKGIDFAAQDYRETLAAATERDVAFLDPPYAATRGRYQAEAFDTEAFYATLRGLNERGVRWILTFDGHAGDRAYDGKPPTDLWRHHYHAPTGRSPFTRLMGTSLDTVVESIYANFDPPAEARRHFADLSRKALGSLSNPEPDQDALLAA